MDMDTNVNVAAMDVGGQDARIDMDRQPASQPASQPARSSLVTIGTR